MAHFVQIFKLQKNADRTLLLQGNDKCVQIDCFFFSDL